MSPAPSLSSDRQGQWRLQLARFVAEKGGAPPTFREAKIWGPQRRNGGMVGLFTEESNDAPLWIAESCEKNYEVLGAPSITLAGGPLNRTPLRCGDHTSPGARRRSVRRTLDSQYRQNRLPKMPSPAKGLEPLGNFLISRYREISRRRRAFQFCALGFILPKFTSAVCY